MLVQGGKKFSPSAQTLDVLSLKPHLLLQFSWARTDKRRKKEKGKKRCKEGKRRTNYKNITSGELLTR